MPATALLAVESAPIITLQPVSTVSVAIEKTAPQPVSKEVVKQTIVSLIEANDTEFMTFLADLLAEKEMPFVKKKKKKQEEKPLFSVVKKERVPYREMPFWKANPDFKPLVPKDLGAKPLSKDFFNALLDFATNPETRPTEEMMIDDLD